MKKVLMRYAILGILLVSFLNHLNANTIPGKKSAGFSNFSFSKEINTSRTMLNINNFTSWYYWNGQSGINPQNRSGGIFPRGTAGVIFQDGFVWGAVLRGVATEDQRIRVGGNTYFCGTVPGYINESGEPVNAAEDSRIRLYRIRKDFMVVSDTELALDASDVMQIPVSEIQVSDIQELRDQYETDWNEWPIDLGAPFNDNNENGIYDPESGDTPGIQNADQVIWFVTHDLDSATTHAMYGSHPIGLEAQTTIWAYNNGGSLGQTMFRRLRLINKSSYTLDSAFVCQWADPDLGNSGDDFAGCDTSLKLGYCYNSNPTDNNFDPFNIAPPAYGYSVLQGPVVPSVGDTAIVDFKERYNYKNLPMSSFFYFGAGSIYGDPTNGDYVRGTLKWYNLLNGRPPVWDTTNVPFFIEGSGINIGDSTLYPLSGDPVSISGDVDGQEQNLTSGDRRLGVNTGPFYMAPGDTQEVVIAVTGGLGNLSDINPNLSSVERLKENIDHLQNNYGTSVKMAELIKNNISYINNSSIITTQIKLTGYEGVSEVRLQFTAEYGSGAEYEMVLFDDGMHSDSLAGDNIWGNQLAAANAKYPYKADLFIIDNGGTEIINSYFDNLRLRPMPQLSNFHVVWENGQQDGELNNSELAHIKFDLQNIDGIFSIDTLEINNSGTGSSVNQIEYLNSISAGQIVSDSTFYFVVQGIPTGDSTEYIYHIKFDHHSEVVKISFPTIPWQQPAVWGDTLDVNIINGSVAHVFPIVADPTMVTGHTYHINFLGETSWQLEDLTAGILVIDNQIITDQADPIFPHPVVDGIQWQVVAPEPDFTDIQVVANTDGPLNVPADAFPYWQGGPEAIEGYYDNQQSNPDVAWFIHGNGVNDGSYAEFIRRTTMYTGGFGETVMGMDYLVPRDYEVRFTPGRGLFAWSTETMEDIPFQVWCTGEDSDDASDDYQCVPHILEDDADGLFNWQDGEDHMASGGLNDPFTEVIYWVEPQDRSEAGYNTLLALHEADPATASHQYLWAYKDDTYGSIPGIIRMVFVNWNGGDVAEGVYNAEMPEEGTVFQLLTTKSNQPGDILEIDTSPVGINDHPVVQKFQLYQNYPNPFNPATTIKFSIAKNVKVSLEIYNILGQKVTSLVNTKMSPGLHTVNWNGKNSSGIQLSSGIYFYHLKAGDFIQSRKMILLK